MESLLFGGTSVPGTVPFSRQLAVVGAPLYLEKGYVVYGSDFCQPLLPYVLPLSCTSEDVPSSLVARREIEIRLGLSACCSGTSCLRGDYFLCTQRFFWMMFST